MQAAPRQPPSLLRHGSSVVLTVGNRIVCPPKSFQRRRRGCRVVEGFSACPPATAVNVDVGVS
jgi:hypothetical protein